MPPPNPRSFIALATLSLVALSGCGLHENKSEYIRSEGLWLTFEVNAETVDGRTVLHAGATLTEENATGEEMVPSGGDVVTCNDRPCEEHHAALRPTPSGGEYDAVSPVIRFLRRGEVPLEVTVPLPVAHALTRDRLDAARTDTIALHWDQPRLDTRITVSQCAKGTSECRELDGFVDVTDAGFVEIPTEDVRPSASSTLAVLKIERVRSERFYAAPYAGAELRAKTTVYARVDVPKREAK